MTTVYQSHNDLHSNKDTHAMQNIELSNNIILLYDYDKL